MTLAIGHNQDETVVVDCVREVTPPFSPESVVTEFVTLLKQYRVHTVVGDRYGGEWPREQFRKLGCEYKLSDKAKSELYNTLLPALNSGQVELLDHPRLLQQLLSLERRTSRAGRDSIDHPPGRGKHNHDDVINSPRIQPDHSLARCRIARLRDRRHVERRQIQRARQSLQVACRTRPALGRLGQAHA